MGWNSIDLTEGARLFDGIDTARGFYFLHSYYFDAANRDEVAARVSYGTEVTCAVQRDNVFGVQFHPEKSHSNGTRLFENFARLG
jgi:glutamine amidotransferase